MKSGKLPFLFMIIAFAACQPQAETRQRMDATSYRMSDSILKLIDSGLAEPAQILAGANLPNASSASSFTPAGTPN